MGKVLCIYCGRIKGVDRQLSGDSHGICKPCLSLMILYSLEVEDVREQISGCCVIAAIAYCDLETAQYEHPDQVFLHPVDSDVLSPRVLRPSQLVKVHSLISRFSSNSDGDLVTSPLQRDCQLPPCFDSTVTLNWRGSAGWTRGALVHLRRLCDALAWQTSWEVCGPDVTLAPNLTHRDSLAVQEEKAITVGFSFP